MSDPPRCLKVLIAVGTILVTLCGCDPEPDPDPPPPVLINLRVVMFLPTGANPDLPLQNEVKSGGTLLSRSQVRDLMSEFITLASQRLPNVTFNWDANDPDNVELLFSNCMRILPPPFQGCFSRCGDLDPNCPRLLSSTWFKQNVVNQGTNTAAALTTPDAYIDDDCTINIYFTGNIRNDAGVFFYGATSLPGCPTLDFVVINDGASTDPLGPAQFNVTLQPSAMKSSKNCVFRRFSQFFDSRGTGLRLSSVGTPKC